MIRTALSDPQWEIIAPHCLGRESDPGRTGPDPRLFVEAVLWIAHTGCPWRDLPDDFGKRNTEGRHALLQNRHKLQCLHRAHRNRHKIEMNVNRP